MGRISFENAAFQMDVSVLLQYNILFYLAS